MDLYDETRNIMRKYNICANKQLGQNFLIMSDVVEKIIDEAGICKDDLVIEIGPGLGTLTKPLLENAGRVICIELDDRMIGILQDRFKECDNLQIIHQDVLKVDLNSLIENEKAKGIKNAKVVANLPYYITTPIIMKLLEDKLDISSITVMVQKEVAQRLIAETGTKDSGAITYTIRYYSDPHKVVDVPKDAFIPAPKVDSMVIKLDLFNKCTIDIENPEKVFEIIKFAFMQRRKTLVNGLTSCGKYGTKHEVEAILTGLGFDLKIRAEELSLQDFVKIANYIDNR